MDDRQAQERILKVLAHAKFGKPSLNDAENSLLHQAATGELPFCSEEDLEEARSGQRQIRAELIGWLCMDEQARRCVHWRGIKVCGAQINGSLDLLFVDIAFPLAFRYCWLDDVIDLTDSQIAELVLSNSYVLQIRGQGVRVKYDLLFRDGFFTDIYLAGAQVGGILDCRGANFTGDVDAERISVSGSVFLADGFASKKAGVNLVGAQIGGDLDCSGGTFISSDTDRTAINLQDAKVTGSVFLAQRQTREFKSEGKVNLDGAQINGKLSCAGAFSNPSGDALSAYRAAVKGGISLENGFAADGRVNLNGIAVGGDFVCSGANFQSATLNLTDASVATLIDSGLNDTSPGLTVHSPPTTWPRPSKLLVDGFIYGRISSEGRIDVDKRLNWLSLQPQSPFYYRPYIQLAKVLRESGDDSGAKRVLIEMEDRARKNGAWGTITRPLLRWTIGYGYDPLRAFWWAAGLSALGWVIYRRSYLAGSISPSDKDAYLEFNKPEGKIPGHYPSFSPLIYSLENSLPLVRLGQGDKWQPQRPAMSGSMRIRSASEFAYRIPWTQPLAKWQSTWQALSCQLTELWGHAPRWIRSCFAYLSATTTTPRFIMWFLWFQILLGWLLATLLVAGVSGIVHK